MIRSLDVVQFYFTMIPQQAQDIVEYQTKQLPVDVKSSVINALSLSKQVIPPERLPTKEDEIEKQIKQILSPMKTKLGNFKINQNTPVQVLQQYSIMSDVCKLYTSLVSEVMQMAVDFKKYDKDYHNRVYEILTKCCEIVNKQDQDYLQRLKQMFVVFQDQKLYPQPRAKEFLMLVLRKVDKLLQDIKFNASQNHIQALLFNDRCVKIEQTDDTNMTLYQNMYIKQKLQKLSNMEATKISQVTQNIVQNIIKKRYADIQKVQKVPGTHWTEVTQIPQPDERIISRFHEQITTLKSIDQQSKIKKISAIGEKSKIKK